MKPDPQRNCWSWELNQNKQFTVSSLRRALDEKTLDTNIIPTIWRTEVPRKINIFIWRLRLNRLPTKDNLSRRGIAVTNTNCSACACWPESVHHLFLRCSTAAGIWAFLRNKWNALPPLDSCNNMEELMNVEKDPRRSRDEAAKVSVHHTYVAQIHRLKIDVATAARCLTSVNSANPNAPSKLAMIFIAIVAEGSWNLKRERKLARRLFFVKKPNVSDFENNDSVENNASNDPVNCPPNASNDPVNCSPNASNHRFENNDFENNDFVDKDETSDFHYYRKGNITRQVEGLGMEKLEIKRLESSSSFSSRDFETPGRSIRRFLKNSTFRSRFLKKLKKLKHKQGRFKHLKTWGISDPSMKGNDDHGFGPRLGVDPLWT
ncbi:hypothetical protein LXL04_000335 [Taraxacum kok-saghyz]